ncbi:hypothetical protein DRN32_01685 [Thermococci archaeon]|nr:MAG: hypothetical protein DRN32_01685 [Thermococci archaeon]
MDKVSKMLAHILDRVTPDVCVTAVRITRWPMEGLYFMNVYPVHMEYWRTFKRTYPYWKQVAVKYNAAKLNTPCPEFSTEEDLIGWLVDVVNVTEGERSLLRLALKGVGRWY